MRSTRRAWWASVVALVLATTTSMSADANQKAFEKHWVGRRVVLKRPLYSLVYNERSLRGHSLGKPARSAIFQQFIEPRKRQRAAPAG